MCECVSSVCFSESERVERVTTYCLFAKHLRIYPLLRLFLYFLFS